MKIILFLLCILLTLTLQKKPTIRAVDSNGGKYLTDAKEIAIYVYMDDVQNSGESVCYDLCSQIWPPLLVEPGQEPRGTSDLMNSKLSTLTRTDGTLQVVYNGWPLYHLSSDKIKENVGGQGLRDDNFWWVISVEGNPISNVPIIIPKFLHTEEHSSDSDKHLNPSITVISSKFENGNYVTDPNKRALYIYTADTPNSGVTNCYDVCAYYWPPYVIHSGSILKGETNSMTSKLSYIIRTDNYLQVVYNGWPLYYFIGDIIPENVGGQGFADPIIWYTIGKEGIPNRDVEVIIPQFYNSDDSESSEEIFMKESKHHHHHHH
jgi:predicted lipoprotein with Yx(FWY)xxD motif